MRNRKTASVIAALVVLALVLGLMAQHRRVALVRSAGGYDRTAISSDTPPLIVLTTVALGGFKGLFVDVLWLRLIDLCKREEYFKVIPISNWIITLQPNFSSVWVFHAWNLAFNISVQFISAEDRFDWIRRALEMLRDKGTNYNPNNPRICREIAWVTLMRVARGQDSMNMHYKALFMREMNEAFASCGLDPMSLGAPDDARASAALRERLRLDLVRMRGINEKYGALDWRLPDAHAIYWAERSLELSKGGQDFRSAKIIQDALRLSFIRGRIAGDSAGNITLSPKPEMFDALDRYFDDTIAAYSEKDGRQTFKNAHSLFLQNAAFFLHGLGLDTKARQAFGSSLEKYPARTCGRTFEEFLRDFADSPLRFVSQ